VTWATGCWGASYRLHHGLQSAVERNARRLRRLPLPSLEIKVSKGEANFRRALIDAFPNERDSIERYFRDLKSAAHWMTRHFMANRRSRPLSQLGPRSESRDSKSASRPHPALSRKPLSRPAAARRSGIPVADYGVPPRPERLRHSCADRNPLPQRRMVSAGGAGEIAQASGAIIRAAGGDLLPNHEVTKIILEGDRAVGVEANIKRAKTEPRGISRPRHRIRCRRWNTFRPPATLVRLPPLPQRVSHSARRLRCVELFLGLRRDPRELGFRGENYWIFSSFDHDEMYARRNDLLEGHAPMAYLSFPSLKSPHATRHTAEVDRPFSYRALEAYRERPWRRRSPGYESAKTRITDALLDPRRATSPGISRPRRIFELGTPLTFEYFTAAPSARFTAIRALRKNTASPGSARVTPIRNLYLTGTDAAVLGIMGALMGGVLAASRVLGSMGFIRLCVPPAHG